MVLTENTQPHEYLEESLRGSDIMISDLKNIIKRLEYAEENAKNGKSWEESVKDTMVFIEDLQDKLDDKIRCCGDALNKQRGKL